MNKLLGVKNDIKNAVIYYPLLTEKFYNEYKKRFFLALQKYQTSRKTKIVHHLIKKDMIAHASFGGDFSDKETATSFKENKLQIINLNADFFADFVVDEGATKLIFDLNRIYKNYEKEKTIISSQRIYNIKKLIQQFNEKQKKFIEIFDYMKSVDGIYYTYLTFLTRRILLSDLQLKKKVLKVFSDVFTDMIVKIYKKTTKSSMDGNMKLKLDIVSSYFILNYYFGMKSIEIFPKIRDSFGVEAVEFLKKAKHLKMEQFDDLVDLLFETETLKIQKNLFKTLMIQLFGELGYKKIKYSLKDAIAFFCSLNHKNVLFNAVSPNEKHTFNLEEYILNEKNKIILIPGTITKTVIVNIEEDE